jgi:hypothetical protein
VVSDLIALTLLPPGPRVVETSARRERRALIEGDFRRIR